MVTEKTTIVIGKEQFSRVEAYLKSISKSLEALLDIYNLVIPKLDLPSFSEEEETEEKEACDCDCDCKEKEEEEKLEAELKDLILKLLKL